ETGQFYNDNRYYDPGRGGYDQPDPIGQAGGIGIYLYGLDNPLSNIDPLGLYPLPSPGTPLPSPSPAPGPGPGIGTVPNYSPPANDPNFEPEAPGLGGLAMRACIAQPELCIVAGSLWPTDAGKQGDETKPGGDSNVVPFPGDSRRPIPNQCPVDEDGKEDRCAALYKSTLDTCASLTGKKRFMCAAAALENYKQCMEEK
ncbi:RHS repeat domain-containing protein, partial [Dyella humi]